MIFLYTSQFEMLRTTPHFKKTIPFQTGQKTTTYTSTCKSVNLCQYPERGLDFPHQMLCGQQLQKVDTYKCLGLIISSDLSWSNHINSICSKTKRLYWVQSTDGSLHTPILTHFLNSICHWCAPIWSMPLLGLDRLCWHNFEHNRQLKELRIMLA